MTDLAPCRLLELPAELRNSIYTYALYDPHGILVTLCGNAGPGHESSSLEPMTASNPMALTGACKQVRAECSKLFLACNQFKFDLPFLTYWSEKPEYPETDVRLKQWIEGDLMASWVGRMKKNRAKLGSVHLDLGELPVIVREQKDVLIRAATYLGYLGNVFRRTSIPFTVTFNLHGAKTELPAWTIPYHSYSKNTTCIDEIVTAELQVTKASVRRFSHHMRTRHKWLMWFNSWVRICHMLCGTGCRGVRKMNYDELVAAWNYWKEAKCLDSQSDPDSEKSHSEQV